MLAAKLAVIYLVPNDPEAFERIYHESTGCRRPFRRGRVVSGRTGALNATTHQAKFHHLLACQWYALD
jgi:hypothetical protein